MIQTLLIGLTILFGGILNATRSGIPTNLGNSGNTPQAPLNSETLWAQFCRHRVVLQASDLLQSQGRPVTQENVIDVHEQAIAQVRSMPQATLQQQFSLWQILRNY
jgi:hypothetical protein